MTGEAPRRSKRRRVRGEEDRNDEVSSISIDSSTQSALNTKSKSRRQKPTKKKSGTDSTPSPKPLIVKTRRVAGVSTKKFPPISETKFGLLQEKLWREPFWLLIAVTFLNKTAGRSAAPVFWKIKELYPTPEDLAAAEEHTLIELIRHLGLQTKRARRLIKMASAWVIEEPEKGRQYRTLHYPVKGDGKAYTKELVELDAPLCAGLLEIGKIPGCGPYAWDSWRIFCRDVLRGVSDDYNGLNARATETFEPEWRRVLPLDKELRAYLRWMWLREGFIWDHETGEKRQVTEDEHKAAVRGELEAADDDEAYFTAQAREDVYNGSSNVRVQHEPANDSEADKEQRARTSGSKGSRKKRKRAESQT